MEDRATALQRSNETLNRRSEKLRRQALEDPLTGLPNRRRLDQLLASDLRTSSVVLLDVDHFKRVNDEHSHLVGDAVLRVLAQILKANCRQGDTALRFGGEEFALVMEGTSVEGASALAERARASIEAHDWAALAPGLAVTASFGAALGSEAATGIELLALADRRLLTAKQNGRNQVVGPATHARYSGGGLIPTQVN
jgi:diguanylate cyclase (GGDEF)-like protein